MGIDIYAKWRNQTKAEHDAQLTGWSTVDGDKGYLREAYHGGPYVTKLLVEEAFDGDRERYVRYPNGIVREESSVSNMDYDVLGVPIEAKKMRERLPFKEKETGEPIFVYASY